MHPTEPDTIYAGTQGFLDDLPVANLARFEEELYKYVEAKHPEVLTGIVEKMRRDCAVTALFDGSSPVNLGAIVDQMPTLALARATGSVDGVPPDVFAPSAPRLPWLDGLEFDLATGSDAIHSGLAAASRAIRSEPGEVVHARQLLQLLEWCRVETVRQIQSLKSDEQIESQYPSRTAGIRSADFPPYEMP